MFKRIVPVVLAAALLIGSIIIPAAAAEDEEYHILDLADYITGYRIDSSEEAWGLVNFPNEYCAVNTYDMNGYASVPGKFSGEVSALGNPGAAMQV